MPPTNTAFQTIVDAAVTYLKGIDPVLGAVIERIGPCTLTPVPDIFEALIDAIISQQISVKAADAIMARLRAATPGGLMTPEALQQLDFQALRAAGLSTPKANYILNLLEHIRNGQLDLAHLSELDDEVIINQLVAIKGIGRWTAEMVLIFAMGRPDVLPVDDLGFAEGIREVYGLEKRPSRKEMQTRGELWKPYRTFATWYLWAARRQTQKNERERTRIVSL